jgi:hypothetical protein
MESASCSNYAQVFGYLDDTIVQPAWTIATHSAWVTQDQQVLGFINTSLSREVLGHVATCTTSTAVWKEITNMFESQSCACMIQLRICLATTRKGDQSVAEYYNQNKGFHRWNGCSREVIRRWRLLLVHPSMTWSRLQLIREEHDWKNRDLSRFCILAILGSWVEAWTAKLLLVSLLGQCCCLTPWQLWWTWWTPTLLEKWFMLTPPHFLWGRPIIVADTQNNGCGTQT